MSRMVPESTLSMLEQMRRAALAAGEAASVHFRPGGNTTARVSYKSGGSPVTEADLAADAAIRSVLKAAGLDLAVFSEEAPDDPGRFGGKPYFVVDPIDGTRAFMQGGSEWCVSIALVADNRPIAGVIHAQARGETFWAAGGAGAFLNGVRLPRRIDVADPICLSGPKTLLGHMTTSNPRLSAAAPLRALAYRLAAVAAGTIAAAIASEGARDWDIAAAEVILAETGCQLLTASGSEPVYNATDPVHPALIAAPAGLARRLVPEFARAAARL